MKSRQMALCGLLTALAVTLAYDALRRRRAA